MSIKTHFCKELASDMNVSDSKAESLDNKLEKTEPNPFRTNTLKRKYKSQSTTKHNREMKEHSIQQKGFTKKSFGGTQKRLEHLMIDLETTASTEGWSKHFMVLIKNSTDTLTTKNSLRTKPWLYLKP